LTFYNNQVEFIHMTKQYDTEFYRADVTVRDEDGVMHVNHPAPVEARSRQEAWEIFYYGQFYGNVTVLNVEVHG